nr:hypothetical protein [Negativicutes bacterium]
SAEKYNLTIIEDAIYAFLRAEPLPAIASYDANRTIYIASLSKVSQEDITEFENGLKILLEILEQG